MVPGRGRALTTSFLGRPSQRRLEEALASSGGTPPCHLAFEGESSHQRTNV